MAVPSDGVDRPNGQPRRSMPNRAGPNAHILVVSALAIPGAIIGGFCGYFYGLLVVTHSSDPLVAACIAFSGFAGAVCVGALPGLVLGALCGFRWTLVPLGVAFGSVLGIPSHLDALSGPGAFRGAGLKCGGLVLLGFLLGIGAERWLWPLLAATSRKDDPMTDSEQQDSS